MRALRKVFLCNFLSDCPTICCVYTFIYDLWDSRDFLKWNGKNNLITWKFEYDKLNFNLYWVFFYVELLSKSLFENLIAAFDKTLSSLIDINISKIENKFHNFQTNIEKEKVWKNV